MNIKAKRIAGVLLCGAMLLPPLRARAQDTTAGGAKAPPIVEPTVNEGEIRVDGKITAINSGALITINVLSFTTPKGKTVELSEPKSKSITLTAQTIYHERGEATKKQGFEDLKLGTRLSVVGRDMGSGKALPAREVAVWPERDGNTRTLTTVTVSPLVAKLVTQGQDALQVKDATNALRLFNRAIEAGEGAGDMRGIALSLGWAANALLQLEQPDKAMENYKRALGLWQRTGDVASQTLSLNNMSLVYLQRDEAPKAVETLERATGLLGTNSEKKLVALTWSNMGAAYIAAKNPEKATAAFERVLPLVRGQADKTEEAEVLAELAYLYASSKQNDKAQETIDETLPLLDAIPDKAARASTMESVAFALYRTKQPDKAAEQLRLAIALFQETGNKKAVTRLQTLLERIEKGGKAGEDDATGDAANTEKDDGAQDDVTGGF